MAPLCHSLRFRYSLVSVCIECLAVPCTPGSRICLFRKVPAHYTSEVSTTVVRFCRCETLRPQLCRRDSARYIYVCIYMPHLHFSAIPRRNDYPTRCIAFLSDRYRAESFRSIFYRYFEILEAGWRFFPKFDSHGLNSHFEILMRARQDTPLVHVIRVLVFVPPRFAFFADNRSTDGYI